MKTTPCSSECTPFPTRPPTGRLSLTALLGLLLALPSLADTKLISEGAALRYRVPTDGSTGNGWRNPGFDDSSWTAGRNGIGYEVTPGAFSAAVIADSKGDWSTGGHQGENSWINGYYDKSNDPDATYQATDFQPFPRSNAPWSETNFWDGGSWNWYPDNVPWDTIGSIDIHPNGENNGVEHWSIRRWSSTVSGPITLRFHLRKSNLSGAGVTGKVFRNGVELFSRAIAGNDGTGFEVYVNTPAAVGDVFDFAQTPVGPSGDTGDGADGSIMIATVLSGTIIPPAGPVVPTALADSTTDWSSTGVQGANNWFYGYYNRTADADGTYDANADFNTTDPNWVFAGDWHLGVTGDPNANPPWDTIGADYWHPNGDNQPQGVHWVIRRWVCEVDGDIYARVRFAKANTSGNGTTLHVFRNGAEVYTTTLNNTTGVDTYVPFAGVFIGDKIDFALDPTGTDGSANDGADSSTFTASIFTGPPPQAVVADSVADWSSAGVQGANGWFYGFYNQTADADHLYDPNNDFNTTDPVWTYAGGVWTLGPSDPPWDTIGQTDWHPNGDNNAEVHWVIKRWVSDLDGDFHANVQFGKQNVNGGNGTTLRVLLNGTQLASYTVAFNNSAGINTNVDLPGVFVGDKIEFALDPLGTDGTHSDGADGSFIRAKIITGPAPVPPKPFIPGIADCITTDIKNDMKGVNSSVFVRIPFDVSDPTAIETLKLKMKYNDGFVAYLNGKEVIRRNTPTTIAGTTVADSIADWSTNPDVVVNGWSYGYYDQSLDADGTYSGGSDFTPFPHDGGGASPTDFWVGNGYDWYNGNPPWDEMFQEAVHPNHPDGGVVDPANPATHLHQMIRRWSATVDANLKARVKFRKLNTGCGDGVRLSVYHNSVQVYSQTIAFNDGVGRDDTFDLGDVFLGDNIDVILGPNDSNDYCDGSAFSAVFFEGEPSIPWDGAATGTRTPTETITPEIFDISSFIADLHPGSNLLAVQGFNASANDENFLINASLLANKVPSAANDVVGTTVDTPAIYPASLLLANDSDVDGDRLLLVGVNPNYQTEHGGVVRLYGDTVRYSPPAGFVGTDSFQYTMTDLSGVPVQGSVTVVVTPPNACPTNSGATILVDQGGSVNFQLSASDPDGDALQYSITTAPAHGVLAVVVTTGQATYTPVAGYCGPDSFAFKVNDGKCESDAATVTIAVNCCPTAAAVTVAGEPDATTSFQLTGSDADGNPITYVVTQAPAHGTVVLNTATGAGTYTPNAGYCGPDSFKYKVSDGHCDSADATVSISIRCLNTPPTCALQISCAYTLPNGSNAFVLSLDGRKAVVILAGSGTDAENDPLQFSWLVGTNIYNGAVISNSLAVGCHTVILAVSDGHAVTLCETNICVISAGDAVEQLMGLVNDTDLGPKAKGKSRPDKHPLLVTLDAAAAAFDKGHLHAGANNLQAFQNKVQAQLGRNYPAEAARFIAGAQQILDAVDCASHFVPGKHGGDDDDQGEDDHGPGNNGGKGRDR